MKRDPHASMASHGLTRTSVEASKLNQASAQIQDPYDRRVDAIATQSSLRPSFAVMVKAIGTLVFLDLLRAFRSVCVRRTDRSRLCE